MKIYRYGLLMVLSMMIMSLTAIGQTAVSYTGMGSITCPAVPTATISPSVTGLTFSQLSRGSGVTCASAATGISGSGFNGNLATNISGSKWYTFSITSNSSTTFTLSSISVVSQVSSATGTPSVEVQYSIDAGSKTSIGSFTPTASSATYNITPGSPISVGAGQVLNIFIIPNTLTAAGTTCRVNNNTSATVTATSVSSSLAQLTNGISTSPLIAGATDKALLGFSITSSGTPNFSALNIQTSSTSVSKITNIKLYTSTDNDYSTSGDNSQEGSVTVNQTATEIQLSGFSSALSSSAKNYFIVADIDPGVTGSTPSVLPSFTEANVTVSTGTVNSATITGTDYSFQAATEPTISITGSLSAFGNVIFGNSSSEQSYSVSGTNLTADISVTAPSGFEVSTTSGSGFGSNVNLTQSGGTVSSTTIYVRYSPASATGATGSVIISHTSTGATTQNQSVSGNAIDTQPTTAVSVTFGTITGNTIDVNFTGGDGERRIVVARSGSAVDYTPTDGVTPSGVNSDFSSASDQGSGNKIVFDGSGASVSVTGLSGATTYHFAVFEYNVGTGTSENYYSSSGVGNQTTSVPTFVWNASGTASFATTTNWTPTRTATSASDILEFSGGGTITVTNVPTQTVGKLLISNNTIVNLQSATAANTLTIGGGSGTDLDVAAGSELNINGANSLKISIATGAVGSISGSMNFLTGSSSIDAVDASGLTFNNGSILTQYSSGNAFTNAGTANAVVFSSGSTLILHTGSNPFGLTAPNSKVVFNSGSLYKHQSSNSPSVAGRTYANFEYDTNLTISVTGATASTFGSVTITNGTFNLNVQAGINLTGNISVASGATFGFSPASSATMTLQGSSQQSINGSGTLTIGSNGNITLNNSTGLLLQREVTFAGLLTLTSGKISLGSNNMTYGSMSGASASSYVDASGSGELRKSVSATGSFTLPIGDATNYSPVDVNLTAGSGFSSAYIGAKVTAAKHGSNTSSTDFLNRYWTLSSSGITSPTYTAIFTYVDGDIAGTESNIIGGYYDGSWGVLSSVNTGANAFTATDYSTFGVFTGGENGAMPVEIVSFAAAPKRQSVSLSWATATEVNNAGFEVERMTAGEWKKVGFVEGSGSSNSTKQYSYKDNTAPGKYYYRLKQIDQDGKFSYSQSVEAIVILTAEDFELAQNFPNPFNPSTSITFAMKSAEQVNVTVYNALGQAVASLFNGVTEPNRLYTLSFDGTNLSSGLYFYTLRSASRNEVKKMLMMK